MNAYIIPGLKNMEEIEIDIICNVFQVNHNELFMRTRKRAIVEARQFYFWHRLTKEKKGPTIARQYGYDHATALHAKKTVNNIRETDPIFREKTERAMKEIANIKKQLPL